MDVYRESPREGLYQRLQWWFAFSNFLLFSSLADRSYSVSCIPANTQDTPYAGGR